MNPWECLKAYECWIPIDPYWQFLVEFKETHKSYKTLAEELLDLINRVFLDIEEDEGGWWDERIVHFKDVLLRISGEWGEPNEWNPKQPPGHWFSVYVACNKKFITPSLNIGHITDKGQAFIAAVNLLQDLNEAAEKE